MCIKFRILTRKSQRCLFVFVLYTFVSYCIHMQFSGKIQRWNTVCPQWPYELFNSVRELFNSILDFFNSIRELSIYV